MIAAGADMPMSLLVCNPLWLISTDRYFLLAGILSSGTPYDRIYGRAGLDCHWRKLSAHRQLFLFISGRLTVLSDADES